MVMMNLSKWFILSLLIALSSCMVYSEVIFTDSFDNAVGKPLGGGQSSALVSGSGYVQQTPLLYTLNIYVNNGISNGLPGPFPLFPGDQNSYYFESSSFGTSTLISSGYSSTFNAAALQMNTTANQYVATAAAPINATGLYQFVFYVPYNGV